MKKNIEKVYKRPAQHGMVGDGFRVFNYLPNGGLLPQKRMSPFLLLDFGAEHNFPPSNSDRLRGVDVHPHKGFETVTIAYKGSVAHYDSTGKSGIIKSGDVQWMTAGAGILHKEFHEKEYAKKGGPFEMVQLWVNLPKKDKSTAPGYQEITSANISKINLPENAGEVNVIAGDFNGTKGAAKTFTDVNMFDIKLKKGGKLNVNIPATHNSAILVVEGSAIINDQQADLHNFILFGHDGEEIEITANEDNVLLIISGEPINEPIVSYGPFVMNSQEEIREAIQEFQSGKFGVLN